MWHANKFALTQFRGSSPDSHPYKRYWPVKQSQTPQFVPQLISKLLGNAENIKKISSTVSEIHG